MNFKYGAMPPNNYEWQIGKSVASIKFVNDAESVINQLKNNDPLSAVVLQNLIELVKSGKVVFNDFVDIGSFLSYKG